MKEKFIDLGLDEEIALKCVNLFKSELKTQLKEQSKPTEAFDDTAFKTEIADLKKQLKESAETHTKELYSIKLETALEKALTGANVINQKALKPFLTDLDKAEFEENGAIKGLAEQLKALTESDETSFLFKAIEQAETVKEPINIRGAVTGESGNEPVDRPMDLSKMGYTAMNEYLQQNPNATLN